MALQALQDALQARYFAKLRAARQAELDHGSPATEQSLSIASLSLHESNIATSFGVGCVLDSHVAGCHSSSKQPSTHMLQPPVVGTNGFLSQSA